MAVVKGKARATRASKADSESLTEEEYVVEKIIEKQFDMDGKPYYFVKWLGYHSNENTWEPLENLGKCLDLIQKFESKQRKHPSGRGIRTPERTGPVQTGKAKGKGKSGNEEKKENGNQENEKVVEKPKWSSTFHKAVAGGVGSQKYMDLDLLGPTFRRIWRESEEPLCILGSAVVEGVPLHLVRLKPTCPEELSKALEDVDEGVTMDNTVIVLADHFKVWFPEMVIRYYQGRLMFEDNAKTPDENTQVAARAALFHQYHEKEVQVNAAPIFKDMMGDVPGHKKEKDKNDYYMDQCGDPEPYEDTTKKDEFGLPEYYSESDDDDQGDDKEGSSDSSGDENIYVEIKGSLKKKRYVRKQ